MTVTSIISNLLTVSVAPGIKDFINNNVKLIPELSKGTRDFDSAGNMDIPVQTEYNQSFGFTDRDGALPYKGEPAFDKFTVGRKLAYVQFQASGEDLRLASKEKKLAINLLEKMRKDIRTNVTKQMERVVFGLGNGRLGKVSATNNSTTITLNASNSYDKSRYIKKGMRIGIADATGAWANLGNGVVTAINHSTHVATVSGGNLGSVAANDIVTLALQETGEFSYGKEMMGLLGIVDDGTLVSTFQSATRSSSPWACGNVISNSGTLRPITTALLNNLLASRGLNSNVISSEKRLLVCNRGIFDEVVAMYEGQIQMAPGEIKAGVADDKLTFNGYTFLICDDAPYYMLFDITPSTIESYMDLPFEFISEDGNVLQRDVGTSNRDSYVGTGKLSGNFVCNSPPTNSVLSDISQTVQNANW